MKSDRQVYVDRWSEFMLAWVSAFLFHPMKVTKIWFRGKNYYV